MIIFETEQAEIGFVDMHYSMTAENSRRGVLLFNGIPLLKARYDEKREATIILVAPEHAERIFDSDHVSPL